MNTTKYNFKGLYAQYLEDYLEYRHSLGFKVVNDNLWLSHFDRMTLYLNCTEIGITKDIFQEWLALNDAEKVVTKRARISALNGFSSYLQLLGYDSYIGPMLKGRSAYSPHIFTQKEIADFFSTCDRLTFLEKYRYITIVPALPCIFRLLYGTGARVGEIMSMTNEDVDLSEGIIILRNTKNDVDRMIPLSLSLREICKDYHTYKLTVGIDCDNKRKFFTPFETNGYDRDTVYEWFRKIISQCGISHGGRGAGPRVHDFRHTFAVKSLLKMTDDGIDYYTSLPILKTYLGHKTIESTAYYLHLVKEMYPSLFAKMESSYNKIFTVINMETAYENEE